jgi:sterol desaturase/sphingolipid hydroxylase (fatty acid hydroxylase superfamily)
LHGIHHSAKADEMNSNWSSGLTVWDFLHGTFRDDVRPTEITIGAAPFDNEAQVKLNRMLMEPFRSLVN